MWPQKTLIFKNLILNKLIKKQHTDHKQEVLMDGDVLMEKHWYDVYRSATLNTEKAERLLGYNQRIDFDEGIQLTKDWLVKSQRALLDV